MQNVYGLRYWRCHCDEFVLCDDDNSVIGAPKSADKPKQRRHTNDSRQACHLATLADDFLR